MALRVLIVDDEPLARQELEYLLENVEDVEVLAVGTNGIEAVELIETHHPDLVFLDVQMPGLDGFGVLKLLIEKQIPLPQVVFATAYDQYAVRAFEVNAVDYLLKPFDLGRVAKTLEKVRLQLTVCAPNGAEATTAAKLDVLLRLIGEGGATLSKTGAKRVVVKTQNRLLLVDEHEICFATIADGAISVTTDAVEGQSNCRTLEELGEQLNAGSFWRVHRSFLVNIQHIHEVVPSFKSSYQLRMDDPKKTEIPVSRGQTKRLRELFKL
jgi:two-component system response regulator LytT